MDFIYTENCSKYQAVLNTRIQDNICKHVLSLASDKARKVFETSLLVGYNPQWGANTGINRNPIANHIIQQHTIRKMIHDGFDKPFRIVIDHDGIPWIDNIHSAIRDIFLHGDDIMIKDVKCYIIDTRTFPYTIVNINHTLYDSITNIQNLLQVADKRLSRIHPELKNIGYTIHDLIMENNLIRD